MTNISIFLSMFLYSRFLELYIEIYSIMASRLHLPFHLLPSFCFCGHMWLKILQLWFLFFSFYCFYDYSSIFWSIVFILSVEFCMWICRIVASYWTFLSLSFGWRIWLKSVELWLSFLFMWRYLPLIFVNIFFFLVSTCY